MDDLTPITERGRIIAQANEVLTPELSAKIGAVHGTYIGENGIVVVARDYSNNSRMLKRAYISGVMSAGVNVLNLHSAPLPLVEFCIRRFGANGGGVFFGSGHTYGGETSIRFFDSSGIEYSQKNIDTLITLFKQNKIFRAKPGNIGSITSILQTFEVYKKTLPQFINKKKVAEAHLKVVMDCSHGPVGELAPEILNTINISVIALNTYYRPLSNKLYPNLESIRNVASIVKASAADIGVIFDSDGSRAMILDENGGIIEYEELLMMFLSDESLLKIKNNPIITTVSTSKILDEFAKSMGYTLHRIQSRPSSISRAIREDRGVFGASDTYKFYFPAYGPFPDGTFTLLKLLELLASKKEPLSSIVRNFPKSIKTSKTITVNEMVIQNFETMIFNKFENQVRILNSILGAKVVFDNDSWVRITPSLYRNSLILTAEATELETRENLIRTIEELLVNEK